MNSLTHQIMYTTVEKKKSFFSNVISGCFFIAGTAIGAGMLGFPLITGKAGFFPASLVTIAVWLFMYLTGLLMLEISLWMPKGSNILSMAETLFGKNGKYIAGIMFIFLYYSIMIAYFAAGGSLISEAGRAFFHISLDPWKANLFFGLLFGSIVAIGPLFINRVNIFLTAAMCITWILLIGMGMDEVRMENLLTLNFFPAFAATPVLFSAFGYHNVIPPLCTFLDKQRKPLRISLLFGTLIPLVMYLLWQWMIMGIVPQAVLDKTLMEGRPVTAALLEITGKPWILTLAQSFAFFAIVTSTLGVSFSMVDFLGDGLKMQRKGFSRIFLTLLTFAPPFICASINPAIFDTALGIAGGFGEAFLNGLVPIFFVWAVKTKEVGKSTLILLLVLSITVIGIEIYNLLH